MGSLPGADAAWLRPIRRRVAPPPAPPSAASPPNPTLAPPRICPRGPVQGPSSAQPIYVLAEPGTDRLLLIQHLGGYAGPGRIHRFKNEPPTDKTEVLLEINRIAFGMTFHPDFLKNGYI